MRRTIIPALFVATVAVLTCAQIYAASAPAAAVLDAEDPIVLFHSDGTAPSVGLDAVNARVSAIGVRVSQVEIPSEATPILRVSPTRALAASEADALIENFRLGRRELIEEIKAAGRTPAMHQGGYLRTSETGVAPYPKVYDMMALEPDLRAYLQDKFGRLHVNSSEEGVGIDEVMTIVAGGPYTWFFVLPGKVVGKLRFGAVHEGDKAWRISYPGLVPHGGYFDAPQGLVVAYAHGPKHFIMRYDDPSVDGFETLGDNPWIDFSGERPVLLDQPKDAVSVALGRR